MPKSDTPINFVFQVRFERRPGYLYVHVDSHDSAGDAVLDYWQQIADARRICGSKKLLVEKAPAPAVATDDAIEVTESLALMGLADVQIAFVENGVDLFEAERFEKAILASRGLKIKIFDDVAKAERWLASIVFVESLV